MAPKVELDKDIRKDLEELSKRLKENEKLADQIMKAAAKMDQQKQIADVLSKTMKAQSEASKAIIKKMK
ncbi:MAG: hypothetical protein H5U20_03935 [Rhodobacteraceae bacterium]|nr:hypothetical protein [Paracoccaceae bacterium]